MSKQVPLATPYPWDNPTMEEAQRDAKESLQKHPFVSSGIASLQKHIAPSASTLDDHGKRLLTRLLNEHQIPLPKGSDTGAEVAADYLYGSNIAPLTRKPPSADASDEAVLESARKGDLSFFVAVLNAIRRNVPPVTTKKIIRSCCMTLRPGDVPGSLDAKEMVLAALFFLSSKLETKSKNLQDLPLIQPAQELGDLEKRAYMKAWEWRIEDITENVLALEQIFFATPSKWRWLSREKFCPRLTEKEEASFFMKGSIPASAAAKISSRSGGQQYPSCRSSSHRRT